MAALVPPSGTPKSGDPLASPAATKINEVEQKPDYLNLPCPGNYEEIHREAWGALKPEFIEGLRFDFSKGITPNFVLSHSVTMGPMEFPSPSPEPIKVPTANYEFGAHVGTPKMQLNGRVTTDGRLMGRAVYGLTSDVSLRASLQLGNEPHGSTGFLNIDYKGKDYRSLLQLGSGGLVGASYIQSVTPNLQLGGELAWVGQHRRAMLNYGARYETNKMVATGQVFSSGMVILTYFQKVSEKVSLATDFMYNPSMRDVTASAGYDYIFRNGRLRGKIDSNGCVGALLEERLSNGLNFLLSGELDHRRKDYRFGYGLTIG